MESERKGVYAEASVIRRPDGTARPNFIRSESDKKYETDCVIRKYRAASAEVGGTGIRYAIQICGRPTFPFNKESGKWFIEIKS